MVLEIRNLPLKNLMTYKAWIKDHRTHITYVEKWYFMKINMNGGAGVLPEFNLPFLSPGGGELSGIIPGKLPIWACSSRPSALFTVSLGHALSVWGLRFSLE
jgi:hypothetical protein